MIKHPALPQILVTGTDNYLALHLAKSLIIRNCHVFGVAKKAPEQLLAEDNFTLLDIDLNQPLPDHLPPFEMIFYFTEHKTTPISQNLLASAHDSKVFVVSDVGTKEEIVENLTHHENVRVLLIGDIYGPPPTDGLDNLISDLITQSIKSDKIILKNEGKDVLIPTYISDAVYAINKFAFETDAKKVKIIISQDALTSLDIAYEIQDQVHKVLAKRINLFFSNHQTEQSKPHPIVRLQDLGYEPKFKLDEGLKEIFEQYKKNKGLSTNHSEKQAESSAGMPTEIVAKSPQKSKKLAFPFPLQLKRFGVVKIAAVLILMVLLFFAKTAFDLYKSLESLYQAKTALISSDFKKAQSLSQDSARHLQNASNTIKILTSPARLIPPGKSSQANSQVQSLISFSNALSYLSKGAQTTNNNLKIIIDTNSKETLDLESSPADFQKAYFLASTAKLLSSQNTSFFSGKINPIINNTEISDISRRSLDFANLLPDFAVSADKKTYLVLFQDNTELRAGGGFIDAYGLLEFEKGHLKNLTFEDIYKTDALLKEKIVPPKELTEKLGARQLFLRDSNTSSDFQTNAQLAQELFGKETGTKTDGVIALDLTFLKGLSEITGSVDINGQKISAQNLTDIYLSAGSKDNFDTNLLQKLFENVTSKLQSNNLNYPILFEKIAEAGRQKHLLLAINSSTLSPYIKMHNLNNSLPPANFDPENDHTETRDFLAIVESNLGANKANGFIDRKIDYSVDVGKSNDLTANLKITYTNKSKVNVWPQGDYVNFLKILAPTTAFLIDYKDSSISKLDTVESKAEENTLASFSTYVDIAANTTKTVTFTYSLGKTLKLEQAPAYHLYVSKQPGTLNDQFSFALNLPDGVQAEKINGVAQNSREVKQETDLTVDREFEISLTKR